MTKSRQKTRGGLTAETEDGKKNPAVRPLSTDFVKSLEAFTFNGIFNNAERKHPLQSGCSLELGVFFIALNYICLSFMQIHAHFYINYIIYYGLLIFCCQNVATHLL